MMTEHRPGDEHSEREHFFAAAKVIAALTVLSRILGMLRDMAILALGGSRATDAFIFAQKVPNLFRRLFGEGALSAAFVPVFSETSEQHGEDRARQLLANAMGLLAVVLAGLVALVLAGLAAWLILGPGAWDRQLLLSLLCIMMPFAVTICLLALGSAALNCRGHFAYPAFAPIILNVFLIAAAAGVAPLLGDHPRLKLYVIAAAFPLAGIAQLAGVLYLLRRHGFSLRPTLRPVQPGVRTMARLMLPMLLGLGFLQVSEILNDTLAWLLTATELSPTITIFGHVLRRPLNVGVLARVYGAQRLYQFPMGVLAISLGVAVFPLLSRYASRGDLPNLRLALNRAVRLSMFEGLAAGAGLGLLAEPVTRLIFQHGGFTLEDAAVTASVLRLYAVGMPAFCAGPIFTRAFYSLKDTRTPLIVSCCLVVPNLLMVALLVWVPSLRAGAFGLAATITFTINGLVLAALLRRRLGLFGGRRIAVSLARGLAACCAMAAVILPLRLILPDSPAIVTAVCVPAGAAAFLLVAWLLRAPELGELLTALRRRKSPSEQA